MNQTTNSNNKEPIHIHYMKLCQINLKAENDIKNLKKMRDQNKITEERYKTLIEKNEKIINEIEPQIESLKTEITALLDKNSKERESIVKNIKANQEKINESNRLYRAGIIDRAEHDEEMKLLQKERKPMEAILKETNKRISELENALGNKEPPTPPGNNGCVTRIISKMPDYLQNILTDTTNYFQRFLAFLVLTQFLCFFLFVVDRFLVFAGLFKIIPVISLAFFGVGIVLMAIFLFKAVKARSATFFSTGVAYLMISILLVSQIGAFDSFLSSTILGIWAAWNLVFSIIILTVGIIRTFLLGVAHDYGRASNFHNSSQDTDEKETPDS